MLLDLFVRRSKRVRLPHSRAYTMFGRGRRRNIACFPASDLVPIVAANGAVIAAAGNRQRWNYPAVSHRRSKASAYGHDVIDCAVGWLSSRVQDLPLSRLTVTPRRSRHHALRIFWVDPQSVIVAVRNFNFIEGAAAVGGLEKLHVRHIERVGILGSAIRCM